MSTPAENTNSTPAPVGAAPAGTDELRVHVIDALRKVYDPEIPVNIYDLGLIYGIDIDAQGAVHLRMTLTSPGCPVAQTFPATVEGAVGAVAGVKGASVELVWEPSWGPDRMTEAAKLQLGML
ncbi:MAG: SUF system Fe-S cluster assembly protein [Pseudomonadota bacterium]